MTDGTVDATRGEILAAIQAVADPERGPKQQAYMKSVLPFWGAAVPEVRRIASSFVRGERDAERLRELSLALWQDATHREAWYAAMTVLGKRPDRANPATIPIIEQMVREGQWWDITDELSHRLAEHLDERPVETTALIKAWARDENLWTRRIAIIAQLGRKDRVDADLLTEAIDVNIDDRDFFIRKAIGWALREYARLEPDWVREFVAARPALSPLTQREALKHIGAKGESE